MRLPLESHAGSLTCVSGCLGRGNPQAPWSLKGKQTKWNAWSSPACSHRHVTDQVVITGALGSGASRLGAHSRALCPLLLVWVGRPGWPGVWRRRCFPSSSWVGLGRSSRAEPYKLPESSTQTRPPSTPITPPCRLEKAHSCGETNYREHPLEVSELQKGPLLQGGPAWALPVAALHHFSYLNQSALGDKPTTLTGPPETETCVQGERGSRESPGLVPRALQSELGQSWASISMNLPTDSWPRASCTPDL